MDGDFLLLELRELLKRNDTIKVVLMSATINHLTFTNYFAHPDPAPLLEIHGRTFPVEDHYLEDIIKGVNYRPSGGSRPTEKQSEEQAKSLRAEYESIGLSSNDIQILDGVSRSEKVDATLTAAVVQYAVNKADDGGGVLVFCPGTSAPPEASLLPSASDRLPRCGINRCPRNQPDDPGSAVTQPRPGRHPAAPFVRRSFPIVLLIADHFRLSPDAQLSSQEQKRVFIPPSGGVRKIVVSTNVAETSITIVRLSTLQTLRLLSLTRRAACFQDDITMVVDVRPEPALLLSLAADISSSFADRQGQRDAFRARARHAAARRGAHQSCGVAAAQGSRWPNEARQGSSRHLG